MTEKELLLIMTILQLLGKPTHPERVKDAYEAQKDALANVVDGRLVQSWQRCK